MKAFCSGCSSPLVASQLFDGRDFGAVLYDGKRQAGEHTSPIHPHRAGPALAVVATLLRSGEIEIFMESIEKGSPRPERQASLGPGLRASLGTSALVELALLAN